jgi:regulator of protease activity HflC (stomatin/prohibitin superfamily)
MAFFRGKTGKTREASAGTMMKVIALVALLLVVVGFVGCSCFQTVETSRVAVITEFGNVTGSVGEGFHTKFPWQEYNIVQVSQVQVEDDFSVATKDLQSVIISATAQIRVNGDFETIENLYRTFLGNHVNGIVKPQLATALKGAAATYTLEELIQDRSKVQDAATESLRKSLSGYGIDTVSIQVTNLSYSEDYRAAVERKVIADQNRQTALIELQTAETQADINRELAASLDDALLSKMIIERWDGKLPYYVGGNSSGLDMLLPQLNNPLDEQPES